VLADIQARLEALRDERDAHGLSIKQVVYLRTYTLEGGGAFAGCQFWQLFGTMLPGLDEIGRRQRGGL